MHGMSKRACVGMTSSESTGFSTGFSTAIPEPFCLPIDVVDPHRHPALHAVFAHNKQTLLQTSQFVALGGGGMHGVLYIGALMALCNGSVATFKSWVADVQGIAGTSAGSIIGFMLACGMDPWQMRSGLLACNLGRVMDSVASTSMEDMQKMGALCSGAAADEATRDLVLLCADDAELTFLGMHRRTRRTFIVCVTNVDTGRTEYWSHWSRPDMPVWFALRCSSSVPVVFNAPTLDGSAIYDGGVTCNIPCHVFPAARTLTLFSYRECQARGSGMPAIATMGALASMATTNAHIGAMRAVPLYATRSVPCVAPATAVSRYAYNATADDVDGLIRNGFASLHGVLVRNALFAIVIIFTLVGVGAAAVHYGVKCPSRPLPVCHILRPRPAPPSGTDAPSKAHEHTYSAH